MKTGTLAHRVAVLLAVVTVGLFSQPLAAQDRHPNVLLIAVDDLRCDLGAMGVAHAKTPRMDALARTARVFNHHYVQVPTCGASRCALLRGKYPSSGIQCTNKAIAKTHEEWGSSSLPTWFLKHGYQTYALGKITHYPGGRTGHLWADGPEELPSAWTRCWIPQTPWGEPERIMHGYANGKPRTPGMTPPWEAFDGDDKSYPDAWIADEAVHTLKNLATQPEPWLFAVGFFKPHLPFAAPKKWYDQHPADQIPMLPVDVAAKPSWPSGWHASGEFRGHYGHADRDPATDADYRTILRQGYAACISYCDAQIGRVIQALNELNLDKQTIVVLWGDHGFLLGEHAIWGKHCLYEEALRSPLLIRAPDMIHPGETSSAVVESIDVFPTLLELCKLPVPAGLNGRSLKSQLGDPIAPSGKPAIGFTSSGYRTVRTDRWRLIAPQPSNGQVGWYELFDYQTDPRETQNLAEANPDIVRELAGRLPEGYVSKE